MRTFVILVGILSMLLFCLSYPDIASADPCGSGRVIGAASVDACSSNGITRVTATQVASASTSEVNLANGPVLATNGTSASDSYLDLGSASVPTSALVTETQRPDRVVGRLGDGTSLIQVANADGSRSRLNELQFLDPVVDDAAPAPAPAADQPAAVAAAAPAPTVDVVAVARQAVASLALPSSELGIDPAPSANEWGAAAVGQQLWFWAPNASRQDTQVSSQGIDIAISAVPLGLVVDTGDGTRLNCTSTDRLSGPFQNQPSPSCGHAYATKGSYTIGASRAWQVNWSALGQSGTETVIRPAGQTALDVIELHSLLVPVA